MPLPPPHRRPEEFPASGGFTLVELSIVLVVIALMIGGIMGGQEMVRASKLQSLAKNASDVREAFQTFRDKYGNWPGDLPDAKSYWSACTDVASNPCNGDGDGQMFGVAPAHVSERYRAWQHLSLSGIVPGNYTGQITSPSRPGENVYPGPFDGSTFFVGWHSTFNHNNNFIISSTVNGGSLLNAADAKSIDQKVDDGIAFRGRVYGVGGVEDNSYGCPYYDAGVAGHAPPWDYNVSVSKKQCDLRFNWIDATVDQ